VVLHRNDVSHVTAVLFSPELVTFGDIHELNLYVQGVTLLKDAPCQHCRDTQRLTYFLGVEPASKAKGCASSLDLQSLGLGEPVYQALGYPLGQVIYSGVVPGVLKRQDCQRFDGWAAIRGGSKDNDP